MGGAAGLRGAPRTGAAAAASRARRGVGEFGGVPSDASVGAARRNARALRAGLEQTAREGGTLVVPAGERFYALNVSLEGVRGAHLSVEGEVWLHGGLEDWPNAGPDNVAHWMHLVGCEDFRLDGGGKIEGQGHEWWLRSFLNDLPAKSRPKMFQIEYSRFVTIEDIEVKNGPFFHIGFQSTNDVVIRRIKIMVDLVAQRRMFFEHLGVAGEAEDSHAGLAPWLPLFPLNTDGIDPHGRNYLIEDIFCENYDDVVAVKPGEIFGDSGCTGNITVRNAEVVAGVGMSIGSVPPNARGHCIEDVYFGNVTFKYPLKTVYIKTNSGDPHGWGTIRNITYEHLRAKDPVLWPIYIGPQQQKEPDGSGDGIWPPTQPLVDVQGVTVRDMVTTGDLMQAGVLRCNETNPCRDILFEDVHLGGWLGDLGLDKWSCEHSYGECRNCHPRPKCLKPGLPP